ncbi:MAG: HAD-IB family hydrolase [Alphaproteobacteria bacterium]|nr:HAD-IB family hydrolase [Alphaproteobacteria bacterium]
MPKIALFDMDRTIVKFGTYTPFLLRYTLSHAPWRLLFAPVVILCMLAYKAKIFSRKQLKEIMFALLVGRVKTDKMRAFAGTYAETIVPKDCFSEAINALNAHREAGDITVLATASFAFYVEPIAKLLGFDHVVGTGLTEEAGRFRAKVPGENCYGDAKRQMVEDLIKAEGLKYDGIRFYTDDHSDIPTMELATEGVVVNPTPKLRAYAEKRDGIEIVNWQ